MGQGRWLRVADVQEMACFVWIVAGLQGGKYIAQSTCCPCTGAHDSIDSIAHVAQSTFPQPDVSSYGFSITSAQYAQWEEAQKDYRRARSVWERCLNIGGNSRQASLWLKYAEMEMRGKYVGTAYWLGDIKHCVLYHTLCVVSCAVCCIMILHVKACLFG